MVIKCSYARARYGVDVRMRNIIAAGFLLLGAPVVAEPVTIAALGDSLTQGFGLPEAQGFVPQITEGDKRILMIDGEPVPYALARIPSDQDFRGNLAKGGRGVAVPLDAGDRAARCCGRRGCCVRVLTSSATG